MIINYNLFPEENFTSCSFNVFIYFYFFFQNIKNIKQKVTTQKRDNFNFYSSFLCEFYEFLLITRNKHRNYNDLNAFSVKHNYST